MLYKPYYINFSLLIISIGFLFKISAAPFHFWSPYKRPGKSYLLGNILSNYGNTLGIMVPSLKRNYINGWTNYSCMVTSQNIYENNVVSHVSKSVILNNIVVKEQRVYDSRYGNILLYLRCILMDFEIKYQIKNHSNLIIQKQFYSAPTPPGAPGPRGPGAPGPPGPRAPGAPAPRRPEKMWDDTVWGQ